MKYLVKTLTIITLILAFLVFLSLTQGFSVARADGISEAVMEAIQKLQPRHTPATAAALTYDFVDAGQLYDIDPLLLVAIARRESSLMPGVIGKAGEIGLMQVHGAALLGRPENCPPDLSSTRCEILTGAQWLAKAKEDCPGSPYRWVAHYGHGKCMSLEEAKTSRGTETARKYYLKVGGNDWD